MVYVCFFFFQAEDGIRDYKVTGVQTCALPISSTFTPFIIPAVQYLVVLFNLLAKPTLGPSEFPTDRKSVV